MNSHRQADPEVTIPRSRLVGVQYLRGIAALSIVAYHVMEFAGGEVIGLAAFGVPLFFVISGFIMVAITDDNSHPRAFLARRIVRIGPMYWLMTIAVLLVWPQQFHGYRDLAASFAFLPFPYEGADRNMMPPLAVGWTLNLEMVFYILFALTLLAPSRNRPLLLTVMLIVLVSAGQALPSQPEVAFWGQPLVLLFAVGSWMGHSWARRSRILLPSAAFALLAAFVLYLFPSWQRYPGEITSVLAIATMAVALHLQRRGLFRRAIGPLGLLGDASYSIYLSHPIVLFLALRLLGGSRFSATTGAALIIICVVIGISLFLTVEAPLLRRSRELLKLRSRLPAEAW